MVKQKIKIDSFDIAKGIFAVMMMYAHSLHGYKEAFFYGIGSNWALLPLYVFDKVMCAGSIPMMCIICGYGFRKKTMRKAVEGQLKYTWKPYLIVALAVAVGTVVKKLLIRESVLEGLRFSALPFLFGFCPEGIFLGLEMNTIGPVWFVVMYVVSGIMLNAVLQEERTWVQLCLVIIGACAGMLMRGMTIPFCLRQSLICTLYMYIGWLMKKNKYFETEIPLYFRITVTVGFMIASLGTSYDVAINAWGNGMTDVLIGAFGGVVLLRLFLRFNRFEGQLANSVRWLGRNVMPLCCVHGAMYVLLPLHRLYPVYADRPGIGILIQLFIYLVTGIGGCFAVDRLKAALRGRKQEAIV